MIELYELLRFTLGSMMLPLLLLLGVLLLVVVTYLYKGEGEEVYAGTKVL